MWLHVRLEIVINYGELHTLIIIKFMEITSVADV